MKTNLMSRRRLLGGMSAAALLGRFGQVNALAQAQQQNPGYKALVCILLAGGNDGHNTIVPLTQSQFNAYQASRGGLALPDNNGPMLQVETPDGTPYGLNPGLTAIHPLWAQGHLAVLANNGMLVEPVNRGQFTSNQAKVPTNLFSHSDQIQQMQTAIPSTSGGTGWGARTADVLQPLNGASTFPTAVSMAGPALFCRGAQIQSASLFPGFDLDMAGLNFWPASAALARKNGVQQVLSFNSGMELVQAANQARKDAIDLNALLTSGGAASIATTFPGTSLGAQLQQVAKVIKLRASTGMSRQVFLCSLGGFDTHGSQAWQHWDLLRQVSEAMAAFYNATVELGVADCVTTFTISDFGRTLQPSGSGCDHGWGNHHLIMGAGVQGGTVHGIFPELSLGGPDDSGSRGALIPTTSTEQYGATLARWMGVPENLLSTVFPTLGNFTSTDLGFMV